MNREEFWKYIHKPGIVRQDYIVSIRLKQSENSQWNYINELLTVNKDDPFYFIWDNDWWEGEKFVEILGYISIDDVLVPSNLKKDYKKDLYENKLLEFDKVNTNGTIISKDGFKDQDNKPVPLKWRSSPDAEVLGTAELNVEPDGVYISINKETYEKIRKMLED